MTRWFRKHTKILMVFLAVFAMAIFGLGDAIFQLGRPSSTQGEFKDEVIATWQNNKEIKQSDLSIMLERHYQVQRFLEKVVTTAQAARPDYRPLVPLIPPIQGDERSSRAFVNEQLVERFILARKAEKEGLVYTDSMIDDYLDLLSGQMGLSTLQLKELNRQANQSGASYEVVRRHLRQELLSQQMRFLTNTGFQVTANPTEAAQMYQRVSELVQCDVMPISVDQYSNFNESAPPMELKKIYDEGKYEYPDPTGQRPGFKRPNRVAIQYIMADNETFSQNEINKLTAEQVQAEYDRLVAEKDNLVMEEVPPAQAPQQSEGEGAGNPATETPAPTTEPDSSPATPSEPSTEPIAGDGEAPQDPAPAESTEPSPTEEKKDEQSTPSAAISIPVHSEFQFVSLNQDGENPNQEPGSEEPQSDEPQSDEPKSDEPKSDEPTSEEPKSDAPQAQEPAPAEPAADQPAADQPAEPTQEPMSETPDAPPAAETPAAETPATETPATETPATETPATETPATETPATDQPSAQEPVAETPTPQPSAAAQTQDLENLIADDKAPELRAKPLVDVADQIKRKLVAETVAANVEKAIQAAEEELDMHQSDLMAWESNDPQTRGPQPKIDYQEIAKRYGLVGGETELMDYEAFEQTPLGKTIIPIPSGGQFSVISVAQRVFGDYDRINKFAVERQADFMTRNQYIYWLTEKVDAVSVPFDECKDEVEKYWKRSRMVEEAQKKAQGIVSELNASQTKLKEKYGETVTSTGEFSWFSSFGQTAYGQPEGVTKPGEEFMKSVFALSHLQCGVATNSDQSVVYVVQMMSERKGIDTLGTEYVENQFLSKKSVPDEVQQLMTRYAREYNMDFNQELHDEMGLKFLKQ